jgi:hypothetical protein
VEPHQLHWSPLDPAALPDLLAGVGAPWWLAGGWSIDAFVGRVTRVHEDTDVLVLRRDQAAFRSALASWDVHAADPPGTLRPWPVGETLPVGVHDVWCRPTPSSPWSLQLMIDHTDGEDWVYRRDARLRRPVSSLAGPASDPARQVLAPEVQLLQKSKGRRPKDEADLAAAAPLLSPEARSWLRGALDIVSPGHDWAAAL